MTKRMAEHDLRFAIDLALYVLDGVDCAVDQLNDALVDYNSAIDRYAETNGDADHLVQLAPFPSSLLRELRMSIERTKSKL